MPSQHKNRLLGWHPTSAEDSAWVRDEAERQGKGALTRLLDEALALLRARYGGNRVATTSPVPFVAAEDEQPQQAGKNCKHKNMRIGKGVCPDCNEWVTK